MIHGGGGIPRRVIARLGDAVIHLLNIVAPAGKEPHQRGHDKGNDQRNQRRERRQRRPQQTEEGADRQPGGQTKGDHAHRVNVVDHAATILRLRRRQLEQAFIKGDVGRHHHDPGDGEVGVKAEDPRQGAEHIALHQCQGNRQVDHHKNNPSRIAFGGAGPGAGPRQRAGVGIGDVNFDLRDHHQHHRQRQGQPAGHQVIEDADELLHRFGIVHRRETGQQIEAEEGADDLFDRP